MQALRNLITAIVCHVVDQLPFAFSRRLKNAKDGYFFNKKSCLKLDDLSPQEKLTHYSLLDPDYEYKILGVRNLRSLSQDDGAALLRWKECHELWKKEPSAPYSDHFKETYLGTFFTGKYSNDSKLPRERKIDILAKYTSHCFLSLTELKNGDFFIDSHWFFTEEATSLLQSFSVEHLPYKVAEYETCNPFRRNFSAAKIPSRANLSDRELVRRVDELSSEVERLQCVLLEKFGVKTIDAGVSTLEALSGKGKPYFYEAILPNYQYGGPAKYHAIDKYKSRHSMIWESEQGGVVLFSPEILKKSKIKNLVMSYVSPEKFRETITEYRGSYYPAIINYGLFQYYLLLTKQLYMATVSYRVCIAKSLAKPSKNYSRLYDIKIGFMELIFRARSILNDESFFAHKMTAGAIERVKELIELRLSRLHALNSEIEERKAICHEKVLAENLGHQKSINGLVVLLAVLQVIVAIIALNAPITLSWLKQQVVSILM